MHLSPDLSETSCQSCRAASLDWTEGKQEGEEVDLAPALVGAPF
jgi:hypothetical protein